MEDKLFYLRELYRRQKELGLSFGKMWVLRQERKKALKLRKDPKGWRRVTNGEIEQILKAYSPGGKGHWSYDGSVGPQDAPRMPQEG